MPAWMLVKGPTLRFVAGATIALAGADMGALLDDRPVPMFERVVVAPGAVLKLGLARQGARGYLAVAGGIEVPLYLGSRATYIRGAQGGMKGRALRAGDRLPTGAARLGGPARLPPALAPRPDQPSRIRVVLGPQDFMFTAKGVETFLTADWRLSAVSDRMGMRLIGPPLELKPRPDYLVRDAGSGQADIVDDVIPVGGIQVPGGIEPIVMGVENPTAGGYAKIATVISADLGKMGQLMPKDRLSFAAVSAEDAVGIGLRQWSLLQDAARAG